MLEQIRQVIRRYSLISRGDKVLAAVSGGADSLALLHVLMVLRGEFGHLLHVAHLNHQLRLEADADAEYVCKMAEAWKLPITITKKDVLTYKREHRLSPEEAARELRYKFLQDTAKKVGAAKIALGHQADDQAETVLMNLLRGSGLTGLKAMVPRRGNLIRPLLFIPRVEIEAYCRRQGLKPLRDSTNTDQAFRRNRVRHYLIPILAREFNPAIVSTLSRSAVILQEEEEVLSLIAAKAFKRVNISLEEYRVVLHRKKLLGLEPALQRRVLRMAAGALGVNVDFKQVEDAREAVCRQGNYNWPKNVGIRVLKERVVIQKPVENICPDETAVYELHIPGFTPLPRFGKSIIAQLMPPPTCFSGKENEAWLDWDKIEKPVVVRGWRYGDFFRPLGLKGRKKLQDFFTDMHLPVEERHHVPIVVSGGLIAWVAGIRPSEDFKITPATKTALNLRLEQLDDNNE